MPDILLHSLEHALLDGLKMLPFLFLAYLILEYTEHRASDRFTHLLSHSGPLGVPLGAALGLIPQCGFSVAAANLYCGRIITPGTLIAIFAATSDEALPILLSVSGSGAKILWLLVFKTFFAIAAGYLFDLLFYRRKCPADHCHHDDERDHAYGHLCSSCGCEHDGGILKPAIRHTLQIFLFLLAVTFLLNIAMELLGQERIAKILLSDSVLQPFATALVGLIPNCAVSVFLTKLYLIGSVSFGGVVAGLFTGAGVGLAVLFRLDRSLKDNLKLVGYIYLAGAVSGILSELLAGIFSLGV